MATLRELVRRYPVAAIAIIVGVVGGGGWMLYQSRLSQQPPAAAVPPNTRPIGTPVTPTAPPGSAPSVTPTSPSAPAQTGPGQGGAPPAAGGEGRANPFQPLVSSPGSNPAPGGGVTIPPVPPLAPGTAGVTSPVPEYRLMGFLWGDAAFVILEDSQGSYVVGPGDTVKPGVRVVAIDVRREVVRLDRDGTPVELTLSGAVRRPP